MKNQSNFLKSRQFFVHVVLLKKGFVGKRKAKSEFSFTGEDLWEYLNAILSPYQADLLRKDFQEDKVDVPSLVLSIARYYSHGGNFSDSSIIGAIDLEWIVSTNKEFVDCCKEFLKIEKE